MKTVQPLTLRFQLSVLMLAGCLWATLSWGQGLGRPLYVGNTEAVLDPFGRPLPGSHLPANAASRSLVELRIATHGLRLPPSTSGEPHPFNPLLTPDSVGGLGMNTSVPDAGLFWMVFPERPATGTRVFARVYNAPTIEEASFYADSNVMEVTAIATTAVLTFGPIRELDSSIDPATGLSRSWLKYLGDDPNRDSDGDGLSDYEEFLAGTDPWDATCNLSFQEIRRETGPAPAGAGGLELITPVRVTWQSVPGRRYQLQYAEALTGEQVFEDIGPVVTAGPDETELEMWVDLEDERLGMFRVKLVTD